MSGSVQKMIYQRNNNYDYGYLTQNTINWLYNSVPNIVDIYSKAPSAHPNSISYITIVFQDNTRLRWYNNTDHFTLPDDSNYYNSMAMNYIRHNKQDLDWLEDKLEEAMVNNTEIFDDSNDDDDDNQLPGGEFVPPALPPPPPIGERGTNPSTTNNPYPGADCTDYDAETVRLNNELQAFNDQYGLNIEFPSEFICSIKQDVMVCPVTTSEGHTYEWKQIAQWINTGHDKDPNTNQVFSNFILTPNHALRTLIRDYVTDVRRIATHFRPQAGGLIKRPGSIRERNALAELRRLPRSLPKTNIQRRTKSLADKKFTRKLYKIKSYKIKVLGHKRKSYKRKSYKRK